MIGNSGRFSNTLPLILSDQPFANFMTLSDKLFALSGSTWKIALKRLFELLYQVMTETFALDADRVKTQLELDYRRSGIKGVPDY